MFCRECGAECKDDTNFCPKCGASLQLETNTNESETDQPDIPGPDTSTTSDGSSGKKKRKFHWWILIIVAAIVVVIIILVRVLPNSSSSGDYTVDVGGTVTVLGEGFTDRKVTDSDSAILAAQDVANDLEYKNAFDELSVYKETPTDGKCYYRLQQNYNGIPVYQRYTTLVASEDGEPLGLFTDAVDVQEGISLTPTITYEDAVKSINEYASNNWDAIYDDISVSELSDDLLVIFNQNDSIDACLAYVLSVEDNNNAYTVVLNADTGEVLDCASSIYDIATTGTNTDESLKFPVKYNDAGDTYFIYDAAQNIRMYNLEGSVGNLNVDLSYLKQVESVGNNTFGDTQDERDNDVDTAINLYTNTTKIIDFYKNDFGQDIPFGSLVLFYNDGVDDGENAYAAVRELEITDNRTFLRRSHPILEGIETDTTGVLSIGSAFDGTETDVLAHEYTHLVEQDHNAAIGTGCDYGIKEGIADTFACFYTGNWDIDLTKAGAPPRYAHRNAENPSEYGYPASTADSYTAPQNEDHAYATVISHAACLMDESGLFSKGELETLWYQTLIALPTNCLYEDFYVSMNKVATVLGFSSEQKEMISDILFDLGFFRGELVGNKVSFNVYDKQENLYDDYTINVNGHEYDGTSSEDVDEYNKTGEPDDDENDFKHSYEVNSAKKYNLNLPDGNYTISVIDNAYDKQQKRFFVKVRSSFDNVSYDCYDFGADYVVTPGAKLTVVDEEGNEIKDYLAYTNTTNKKGEDVIVSLSDGTISLPELNYYTFIIEVERTTSTATSNAMETNTYLYTVRVKEGSDDELKIVIPSDNNGQDISSGGTTEEDEGSYMEWQQLYADYIEQVYLEEDTAAEIANASEPEESMIEYYYYLIYLNDDDVPELLRCSSYSYYHGTTTDYIMYIQDSQVKDQELENTSFAERGGYISSSFATGAYMTYNVWRLNEQNELVTELDAYEDFTEISVNGQDVSEDEYDKKVQEGTAWETSGEYTVLFVGDGSLDLYDSGEKYASPFATGASEATEALRGGYVEPI